MRSWYALLASDVIAEDEGKSMAGIVIGGILTGIAVIGIVVFALGYAIALSFFLSVRLSMCLDYLTIFYISLFSFLPPLFRS